jgi:hypothetical protein
MVLKFVPLPLRKRRYCPLSLIRLGQLRQADGS